MKSRVRHQYDDGCKVDRFMPIRQKDHSKRKKEFVCVVPSFHYFLALRRTNNSLSQTEDVRRGNLENSLDADCS